MIILYKFLPIKERWNLYSWTCICKEEFPQSSLLTEEWVNIFYDYDILSKPVLNQVWWNLTASGSFMKSRLLIIYSISSCIYMIWIIPIPPLFCLPSSFSSWLLFFISNHESFIPDFIALKSVNEVKFTMLISAIWVAHNKSCAIREYNRLDTQSDVINLLLRRVSALSIQKRKIFFITLFFLQVSFINWRTLGR